MAVERLVDGLGNLSAVRDRVRVLLVPGNQHAPVIVEPLIELAQNRAVLLVPLDAPAIDDQHDDLATPPGGVDLGEQVGTKTSSSLVKSRSSLATMLCTKRCTRVVSLG